MTISETHNDKIVRLLKKDAMRRKYVREYMKEYRRKKKEETGIAQKQYYDKDDINRRTKTNYYNKTVLNDIKYLFL